MTNAYLRRVTKDIAVSHGWKPGTDIENNLMLMLHECGWRPAEKRQYFDAWNHRRRANNHFRMIVQQYTVPETSYRVDFAWPIVKIALEADGWYHGDPEHVLRDRERDAKLRELNWWTFRINWKDDDDVKYCEVVKVSSVVRNLQNDPMWIGGFCEQD